MTIKGTAADAKLVQVKLERSCLLRRARLMDGRVKEGLRVKRFARFRQEAGGGRLGDEPAGVQHFKGDRLMVFREVNLEGLHVKISDLFEILHISRQEGRMASHRRCGDQRVGNGDAVAATQDASQASDMGCDRDARQERQQFHDSSLISGGQDRTRQQFTFSDHRDGGSHPATFDVLQSPVGDRLTTQMIDQDVRVDEVPGHLPALAPEPLLPFSPEPPLVDAPFRHTPSQQSRRSDDDAPRSLIFDAPGGRAQSYRPFDRLQLILEAFNLLDDVDRFHVPPPANELSTHLQHCQRTVEVGSNLRTARVDLPTAPSRISWTCAAPACPATPARAERSEAGEGVAGQAGGRQAESD